MAAESETEAIRMSELRKLCALCASPYIDLWQVICRVRAHPQIASGRDAYGLSPLHYLCANPMVSNSAVAKVLEEVPNMRLDA